MRACRLRRCPHRQPWSVPALCRTTAKRRCPRHDGAVLRDRARRRQDLEAGCIRYPELAVMRRDRVRLRRLLSCSRRNHDKPRGTLHHGPASSLPLSGSSVPPWAASGLGEDAYVGPLSMDASCMLGDDGRVRSSDSSLPFASRTRTAQTSEQVACWSGSLMCVPGLSQATLPANLRKPRVNSVSVATNGAPLARIGALWIRIW